MRIMVNGYIVNLGGFKFFQPCEDSSLSIWQSFDKRSFLLGGFHDDMYLEAIENIADSIVVDVFDAEDNRVVKMKFAYFYCTIEADVMIFDTTFKQFITPKFEVLHQERRFPLWSLSLDNRVLKIFPRSRRYLLNFYNWYNDKGYTIPSWLEQAVTKTETK